MDGTERQGFKAYMKAGADVKGFALNFNEETLIRGIQQAEKANAPVFDLSGRRILKAQKGIFIINGKKVSAGVAKDDAAADVATALAAAINADVDLPVTAAASTATVTLTAKCKGEYIANGTFGDDDEVTITGGISVSVESKAAGITLGAITVTAGVGEIDLESLM